MSDNGTELGIDDEAGPALDPKAIEEARFAIVSALTPIKDRYIGSEYASVDSDWDSGAEKFVTNGKIQVTIRLRMGPGDTSPDAGVVRITLAPGSMVRFEGPTTEVKL